MNEKLTAAAAALRARGFDAAGFATAKEAADLLLADLPARETVAIGGSKTAKQMGLETLLREKGHAVLWHWEVPFPERHAILHEAMNAPVYLCSANALTEDGLIVEIDGTGNRVAALCYGPGLVYIVIGRNKLVKGGYQQAVHRIKSVACPANARRLNLDTPCGKTGSCNVSACEKPMCSMFLALERAPGGKRTQVVLVNEDLGY